MKSLHIAPELKRLNKKNPFHWIAIGFGSGLSPIAPGTIGTLAAIPFYLLLSMLTLPFYLIVIVATIFIGIYACQKATDTIGVEDHGGIVWDEFTGYFITMIAAPSGWHWVFIGFILFRFFDILKPQPVGWIDQHVKGGLGIMIDDIIAGFMALIVMQLFAYFTA